MKHSSSQDRPLGRRRRATAEERQHWIDAWEQGQQTQAEFAAEHGLSVATLRNWLRRAGREGTQQTVRPKFIEVDLDRLIGQRPSTGSVTWEFEIRTPLGWVVAVAPGAPVERLQAVLEALQC